MNLHSFQPHIMSARPADKALRLRHILEVEAQLSHDVAEYLMTSDQGPQLESPADLAKLWHEGSAKESAAADVLERLTPPIPKDTFPGRKLLGRLLAAWDYAREDHAGEAKQLAKPEAASSEETDGDWPSHRKDTCTGEVKRLYGGLVLQTDQIPSSPIMNRLDRLWKNRSQELIQLDKMKTAADYALLIKERPKEEQIAQVASAAALFLRQGQELFPDTPVHTVEQILMAIDVMSHGWLLVGTKQVPSKAHVDEHCKPALVPDWGITAAIAWPAFVRKMAQAARHLGDSEYNVAQYLRVRERQTRTAAATLWGEHQWPWQEAMRKAWEQDLAILWTVTQQSNAYGLQVAIPGVTDVPSHSSSSTSPWSHQDPRGRKRREPEDWQGAGARYNANTPNKDLQKYMCCPDWNEKWGCTPAVRDCPHGLLHRCTSRKPDRTLCGSQAHGTHNHREPNDRGPQGKGKDSKGGKGKGKGKGKTSKR